MVESDSMNEISWVSSSVYSPWECQFYINEIKWLSLLVQVEFKNVGQLADTFVHSGAMQGWIDFLLGLLFSL